jgi:hypothetical protein
MSDDAREYYTTGMFDATREYYKTGMMDSITTNPKLYLLASVVEMIILVLILFIWNPFGFSGEYPTTAAFIVIMFGFIQVSMYFFVREKARLSKNGNDSKPQFTNTLIKIVFTLITLIGTVLAIYLILAYGSCVFLCIFHLFVYIMIAIVALALIYIVAKPVFDAAGKKDSPASLLKLLVQLIFYLPCVFLDIYDWFSYQYSITTHPVWILLGIESLLISLLFIVPQIVAWLASTQGKILLSDPVYLNNAHTIGNYNTLYGDDNSRKYKYSLSAWFWINPQPPNTSPAYTKYTNILEFGGKPAIEYNSLENTLRVTCQIHNKNMTTIYETSEILFQTWNNIVVNYDAGTMDVFINGELVGSRPGVAPYMTFEDIIVGSKNGIQGGIANVIYNDDIMQALQVKYLYNAMKSLPLPVLSVALL